MLNGAMISHVTKLALYARVSGEDQADRNTIQAQLDFLRNHTSLHELPVYDTYIDDGVSGVIPLSQRAGGIRLLADASDKKFTAVMVYRLDRLGRSLTSILDAYNSLDSLGIAIISATEPFETRTAIGRFIFQFLASLAELERETITERMELGRARVIKHGKWTNGPIPFGYDLDDSGRLIPSKRIIDTVHQEESEFVKDLFRRIASGSTLQGECRRLNALGIPCTRKYSGGRITNVAKKWFPSRLSQMVKNPIYYGKFTFHARSENITITFPGLISRELFDVVQSRIRLNRYIPSHSKRINILRSLIVCGDCGKKFSATSNTNGSGKYMGHYYRCNSQVRTIDKSEKCHAKMIRADWIEGIIWNDCRNFIMNPGSVIDQLQEKLIDRNRNDDRIKNEYMALQRAMANKENERDRILTLYRRGIITTEDLESQLQMIEKESSDIDLAMKKLKSESLITETMKQRLLDVEHLLQTFRKNINIIEKDGRDDLKRQIVERLVGSIRVTTDSSKRPKVVHLEITYTFNPSTSVAYTMSAHNEHCYTISRSASY